MGRSRDGRQAWRADIESAFEGEFLHGLAPADIASNAAGAGHDHAGSRNLSVRLAPPPSRRFAPASHTVHAKD